MALNQTGPTKNIHLPASKLNENASRWNDQTMELFSRKRCRFVSIDSIVKQIWLLSFLNSLYCFGISNCNSFPLGPIMAFFSVYYHRLLFKQSKSMLLLKELPDYTISVTRPKNVYFISNVSVNCKNPKCETLELLFSLDDRAAENKSRMENF